MYNFLSEIMKVPTIYVLYSAFLIGILLGIFTHNYHQEYPSKINPYIIVVMFVLTITAVIFFGISHS